jgi:hypothetical protein
LPIHSEAQLHLLHVLPMLLQVGEALGSKGWWEARRGLYVVVAVDFEYARLAAAQQCNDQRFHTM